MTNRPHAARNELRLDDAATFLGVLRLGSIQGAARVLGVTGSQVSKAVTRLERHLGTKLFVRSERGVLVSDAGSALAPHLEELLARAHELRTIPARREAELTVAASSFMNALFLAAIVDSLAGYCVRSLEMPPGIAGAYASEPFFDIALTADGEHWPQSWIATPVGMLRQVLFAAPALASALGPPPVPIARVRQEKFIVPIYNYRGRVISGDDGCPLPVSERKIGHETQTLALALVLAQRTGQLVFAPALAAAAFVAEGALVEVAVEGWDVVEPLSLLCHGQRVSSGVQRGIVAALRGVLDGTSGR